MQSRFWKVPLVDGVSTLRRGKGEFFIAPFFILVSIPLNAGLEGDADDNF